MLRSAIRHRLYLAVLLLPAGLMCTVPPLSGRPAVRRAHREASGKLGWELGCRGKNFLAHRWTRSLLRLQLRGGDASGTGDIAKESARLVLGDEVVREVDRAVSYQAQTQTLVRAMAADMKDTYNRVQEKLAQLEAAGQSTARRELQALATELSSQMQLVASSGLIEAEDAEFFQSGLSDHSGAGAAAATPHSVAEGLVGLRGGRADDGAVGASERPVKGHVSIVKRLVKELQVCCEEAASQRAKVQLLRSSAGDSHDIKQQAQVLEEADSSVSDARKRFSEAMSQLIARLHGTEGNDKGAGDTISEDVMTELRQIADGIDALAAPAVHASVPDAKERLEVAVKDLAAILDAALS